MPEVIRRRAVRGGVLLAAMALAASCASDPAPDRSSGAGTGVARSAADGAATVPDTGGETGVPLDDNGSFDAPINPCPENLAMAESGEAFDLVDHGPAHEGRDYHCQYLPAGRPGDISRMDLYLYYEGDEPVEPATGPGAVPRLGPEAVLSEPLEGCPSRTDSGRWQIGFPRRGEELNSLTLVVFQAPAVSAGDCDDIRARMVAAAEAVRDGLPA